MAKGKQVNSVDVNVACNTIWEVQERLRDMAKLIDKGSAEIPDALALARSFVAMAKFFDDFALKLLLLHDSNVTRAKIAELEKRQQG